MVKLKWFRSIRQDCPGWTKPAFVWFSPRWESICPMKGISKGSRWSTKLILQEQARLESRIDLQEHKLDWNPNWSSKSKLDWIPKLISKSNARLESGHTFGEPGCWCGQRWPRCVFHNGGQNQLLHLLFAFLWFFYFVSHFFTICFFVCFFFFTIFHICFFYYF